MVRELTSLAECERLWRANRSTSFFDDWDLRCLLAEIDGVSPAFFWDGETVLPLGLSSGGLQFFGGRFHNERNRFIGPSGGEGRIFAALESQTKPIRMLGWDRDPNPFLTRDQMKWDVPYNQNWVFHPPATFGEYQSRFSATRQKNNHYLLRRFVERGTMQTRNIWPLISEFMDHTSLSFARRGKSYLYDDAEFRGTARVMIDYLASRGSLRVFELADHQGLVGLCVCAQTSGELFYCLNLYRSTPSRVSNAAMLAMIQYAIENQLRIDGMRGAFSLKPDYGFLPEPRYALVRDPQWVIRPQTDLRPDEIHELYGRRPGSDL